MQDDNNKNDPIFDLTEIEKIQAEIARDLELADSIHLPMTALPKETPQPVTNVWRVPPTPQFHYPPKKQGSWTKWLVTVCLVCTLGTLTFGFAFGAASAWISERGQETVLNPSIPHTPDNSIATTRYAFEMVPEGSVATLADMIDVVSASVVSVTAFTDPETYRGSFPPPPHRRNGTGVIFGEDDERILIVTIHNVVSSAGQVFVRFPCGTDIAAHPFAHDIDINIAVIGVSKAYLAAQGIDHVVIAKMGDASAMRKGETLIALGNSRGEGISVTRGIVSTEEQFMQINHNTERRTLNIHVLQTDASINYGDSGGPLFNTRGEVVGIIDASIVFYDNNAMTEGIGLSVSSTTVQPLLYELINRLRPAIGIVGIDLSQERADALGIPDIGVFVDSIMYGGAAYQAGMLPDDIITGFNGNPVLDMNQLRAQIISMRPGDVVEVRIFRDGAAMVLELTLQAMIFDRF